MSATIKAPPKPGLHPDMPPEEYHGIEAMSSSGLKRMRKSPAHFYGETLDPRRPEKSDTKATANGSLTHCLLLEPSEFDRRYAVVPKDAPNRPSTRQRNAANPSAATIDAIHWWDDFLAETDGKRIVDGEQLASAKAQAEAVRRLPDIAATLSDGYGEASAFWIDEATGELCKCRPDWVSPAGDGVVLVDGKTAQDASPEGFSRAVWNMGYWLQAAWYIDGFEAATGLRVLGFVFAVVESTWPHAAAAYMLDDDDLDAARRENRRLLNLYAECKRSGVWPGYSTDVSLIQLPFWAQRQLENNA